MIRMTASGALLDVFCIFWRSDAFSELQEIEIRASVEVVGNQCVIVRRVRVIAFPVPFLRTDNSFPHVAKFQSCEVHSKNTCKHIKINCMHSDRSILWFTLWMRTMVLS